MLNAFQMIWNFSNKRKGTYKSAVIFSFVEGLFLMTKMFAIIIAIYTVFGTYSVASAIRWIVLLTLTYIIGVAIFSYKMQSASMSAGFGMVKDKRFEFGSLLKNAYLGFFDNFSVGKINTMLTTTLSEIEMAAPTALISVMGGVLGTVSLLIGLFFYEWRIAIISLVGMIVYILVVNYQIKVSRKFAPRRRKAGSKLSTSALLFLQGIKVTKLFSFKNGDKKLNDSIHESCEENVALSNASVPSHIVAGVVVSTFEIIIVLVAFVLYREYHIFAVEKCIVIIILSFMIFSSINQAGSVLAMVGVLDSALNETENLNKIQQVECLEPKECINSDEIVFDNVSFSYGDNEVLKDISLEIKGNSLTAIIGPSGSGKTTLCQLIPRFFEVNVGRILIGGADIKHIPTEELMSKISMVFQKVYLFEDTVYNNIKFAKPNAIYDEVIDAAKKAMCHDFISQMPNKYDTMINEGGSSLSGGEKQRISIARAILKDAPIIILDEATSALDKENEADILKAIDSLTENKTVIMIAHRMKSIQKADKIIAIEDGVIQQEGTHDELMKQEGLYKKFVAERLKSSTWTVR